MRTIKFEWDETIIRLISARKATKTETKATVFYDDNALLRDDPDHSEDEERFVILGISENANILVVCHCYRQSETIIRLISARKATKTETKQYQESR
ncbi:MAG: BrnT family toxin [Oscillospiraceae bacterium]